MLTTLQALPTISEHKILLAFSNNLFNKITSQFILVLKCKCVQIMRQVCFKLYTSPVNNNIPFISINSAAQWRKTILYVFCNNRKVHWGSKLSKYVRIRSLKTNL